MMKSIACLAAFAMIPACGPPPPAVEPSPQPESDADGDTIPDADDECPDEAEVTNGYADDDGCPDVVDHFPIADLTIPQKIYFDHDDWKIKAVSYDVIDAVAQFLIGAPQIELVRIIGHRDPSEPDEYSAELSKKRADSVYKYLVQKGIDPERLEVVGMGDAEPAEPVEGLDQAELNRRVTFEIVE